MAMLGSVVSAHATQVNRDVAGSLADGTAIEAITLTNAQGIAARILTYGATLQSLVVVDRAGNRADIVLGYDDLGSYVAHPGYFGVTVGRYANRIAGGRFMLDGKSFQLPVNNGPNSLHGGDQGFDKKVWHVVSVSSGPVASVVLSLHSPDGDQGYPGNLDVQVTYSLNETGALSILFEAKTDKATVVNLTNHAFFNLVGEGTAPGATGHLLTIAANAITPVDANLIPTGQFQSVAGTPFDFRKPRRIADGIRDGRDTQISFGRGYDHNFVLNGGLTSEPKFAARLEDKGSGRVLELRTTEPGLQLYSGNFLDGTTIGKSGHIYRMGDSISLEPQKFPDSPNHPAFPSARLDPGKPYRHLSIYQFTVER
ncbi:aldose epimerase family protein [Novosphingobium sp.]|uniref:aldose epimerase family protein n=1 Tax=Novosphingobium sp. TaxID=1874826 RepID=UPI0025E245A1|nr:aldose epimerase family protein [Novosphingobium sp.]